MTSDGRKVITESVSGAPGAERRRWAKPAGLRCAVLATRGFSHGESAFQLGANEHVVGAGAQGIRASRLAALEGSTSFGSTA
jgi:hypothetical protein